ncbi:MAG: hypothetical protein H0T51_03135 [Pirellulales bacterium]|nr:hypothetical protein [Pirellulales bacterium]
MNPELQIRDDFYLKSSADDFRRIKPPTPQPDPPAPPPEPARDWAATDLTQLSLGGIEALISDAHRGDPAAVKAFNQFFDGDGNAAWREVGDLADAAVKALGTRAYAGKKAPALSARRHFQALRKQLAEDNATPLEKLAFDRVILASMFGCAVDVLVAQGGTETLTSEKCLKAQALADKRFQIALKSLELARAISRAAVAGPLRLFGSQSRSPAAGPITATG